MSLTVDDGRGRIRSRSLSRHRAPGDVDLSITRDRSAAPAYAAGLGLGSSAIRSQSPFVQPPVVNDDIPVRFDDGPRYSSKDGSMYDYERRPAAAYQIMPGSSPRSSRDNVSVSSPRASLNTLQSPRQVEAYEEAWRRDEQAARKKDRTQRDLAYGRLPGLSTSSNYDRSPASSSPSLNRQDPTYADSPTSSARYGHVSRDPSSPSSSSFTAAGILKDSQRAALYGPDATASSPSVLMLEPPGARRGHSRVRSDVTGRMSNLAISATTNHHHSSSLSGGGVPPSPMLESYHGTYQQVSPMPSPLLLASQAPEVPHFDALSDDEDGGSRRGRGRRARFHDPAAVAEAIAVALRGTGPPDVRPLVDILPSLTHEQVMELRVEYKALVKTGADRKGVNVAKHIKSRLKDDDPHLMKACFATALGRWESEAYWANFWYQSDKMRRELLIEALMGRSNDEIRAIKESFTDKKYDNSLTKCMRTELKEDKFKKAVMMVLEERRMEEFDADGRRLPINFKMVDQDVEDLYRAIKNERGGESVMIGVVVHRSDSHLREVLKEYDRVYKSNFPRDCLKKSSNLVGEMMAHILNGIINKPVRDAMLLHHALSASRKDPLRRELLISRLVRCHWEPHHFAQVKLEYETRYGGELVYAIEDATKGPLCDFLCELAITRMPDDVRQMGR